MSPNDRIDAHFRLTVSQREALAKLGLATLRDLLYHFPTRYENIVGVKPIQELVPGDEAILYGYIEGLKTRKAFRSKRPIAEGYIRDDTGRMKIIWFNQPYLAKMISQHVPAKVVGKVGGEAGKPYLANPEVENIEGLPVAGEHSLFETDEQHALFPVYPESKGITSKWFYHHIGDLLGSELTEQLEDPIREEIRKTYTLPSLKTALIWIHTPQKVADAEAARKRFAFEEIFYIQLAKQQNRQKRAANASFKIIVDRNDVRKFTERFPFEATRAQKKAIEDILADFVPTLGGRGAMARLLEGDVGSGKTAVAAASVYAVATTPPAREDGTFQDFGRLQTAYMVPTEILAKQHFESFISYFAHLPIQIGLITGSGCRKFPSKVSPAESTSISRTQLLKWVANGEIPIVVGTHALIQKTVTFKNLAYVIIDEQHRFGTVQRQMLTRKDSIVPHLLSMTATPIPRTLALTIYGDLDLTLLDEMPRGRKPIKTEIVYQNERDATYEKVRAELKSGRQVYIICPRIDEPDPEKELALNVKSVKEEARRLKADVFPEYEIEYLHSKMTPKEKDAVMLRFAEGKTHILVATSVVEVGVNVENATVIIIEGAERFGLAQLHQLRGRVLRSTHQAYCYVFADTRGQKTKERLKALQTAKNGFELAEYDLSIRGSGELYGKNQSGLSDLAMEAMKNIKMVEAARAEAQKLIKKDPELKRAPLLSRIVDSKKERLHFE
jgi:ATP-dependent DNA helicase RecG